MSQDGLQASGSQTRHFPEFLVNLLQAPASRLCISRGQETGASPRTVLSADQRASLGLALYLAQA